MTTKSAIAPQVGDLAIQVFDARLTNDVPVIITEVSANGRQVTAQSITGAGFGAVMGVYTLRKNGKYALKGRGQWAETLRFKK